MSIEKGIGNKKRSLTFFYFLFTSLDSLVLLKSIKERPAPSPRRIQTINKNNCAPEAIGELNICNNIYRLDYFITNSSKDSIDWILDKI